MTQNLPQLILPIKMERSPERLTSLGGLVVLEELARARGVWERVKAGLEGPRSGRGVRGGGVGPVRLCRRWCGCCTLGGGGWRTCGNGEARRRWCNRWDCEPCRMP